MEKSLNLRLFSSIAVSTVDETIPPIRINIGKAYAFLISKVANRDPAASQIDVVDFKIVRPNENAA